MIAPTQDVVPTQSSELAGKGQTLKIVAAAALVKPKRKQVVADNAYAWFKQPSP